MGKYQVHQLDANAKAIREALEAAGWTVEPLGRPLDYLISRQGYTALVEVKTPTGRLRPSQVRFLAQWPGDVFVVRSVNEASLLVAGAEGKRLMYRD